MKEIVLLGSQPPKHSILGYVTSSSKFKIKKINQLNRAQKLIDRVNPDYVLCTGKIRINAEGKYFLEI